MSRRHETTSSRTTAIVIGFSILSLIIFITLSYFLAPDKPDAAPVSVITFEAPPPQELPQFDFDPIRSRTTGRLASQESTEPEPEPYHDETFATITGTVTDVQTGEPIAQATIKAQWQRNEEEAIVFEAFRESIMEDDSINPSDVLMVPNEEHSDYQVAYTDTEGQFEIYIPYDRVTNFSFGARNYLIAKREGLSFSTDDERDPLDVTLSRGGSVAGRVFDLGTGDGIVAMHISMDPNPMLYSHEPPLTEENGEYLIGGLAPGSYEIRVEHRNTRYKPGKVLPYQRITIEHETHQITGVDFGLGRAGVVWGYTRSPEENVGVTANLLLVTSESVITQGINAAMSELKEVQRVFSTYSDEKHDGYYEIAGVPLDQEWRVYAVSNEFAPQLSGAFKLTPSSTDIRVDINLIDGSDIYGTVVNKAGYPIEGVEIFCIPSFAEFFAPLNSAKVVREDTSDKDGAFALNDMPAGAYNIFGFKKGYKLTARGVPVFPDGEFDINGVVVRLHPIDDGTHIVFGIVSDQAGNPVANVDINLVGFSMESILSDGEDFGRKTTSNEYGEYLFDGVALGKYVLNVTANGFGAKTVTKVWLDQPTDITLGGGARISGTVYVRETNRPFDGTFHVSANPKIDLAGFSADNLFQPLEGLSNFAGQTFEGTGGEFEIFVNPGTLTLRASAESYLNDSYDIVVEENQILTDVRLYLSQTGGSISGRVRTAEGSSPQGATVRLSQSIENLLTGLESTFSVDPHTVGEDGAFQIDGIPNGEYIVVASHPSYAASQSNPILIADSDQIEGVELVLGAGGSLEGTVFQNNRAVPNAIIMVINTASPISTSSDSNGYYRLDGLNAGEHRVIAMSPSSINSGTVASQLGDLVIIETGRTTQMNLQLSESTVP